MAINKNFVVKHGLEVDTNLLFANADTTRVGVNTANPDYTFHVNGGIGATTLYLSGSLSASGILTANNLVIAGYVSAGGTTGSSGQYLKTTGSGVEWATFPTSLRNRFTYTAGAGQSDFPYSYNIGYLDVFVNGVKLKGDGVADQVEYAADDGVNVNVVYPCVAGDIVELIGYNPTAVAAGSTGILGLTVQDEGTIIGNYANITSLNFVGAEVVASGSGVGATVYISDIESSWVQVSSGIYTGSNTGIGTTNPTSKLTVGGNVRVTGVVTATSFVGDGSGLTGVVGSGSGVIVRDSGSLVGTAGTIDFGDNLTVSPIVSGIVTITSSQAYVASAGIATYATRAGFSTYSVISGYSTSSGIATYATIAGYSTSSGISTYATSAGIATYATRAGFSTYSVISGYSTSSGISTYATIAGYSTSSGIATSAQGLTGSPNLVVGIVTATRYFGDGSGLTGVTASGTGIVIKDDGVTVGTAGTIDFGSNLSVSPISAGIVTITATGGGVGVGLSTRITSSTSTGSIGIGSTANVTFTGFKSYMLMKITTSDAAWVTLYTDTDSRTSDATRDETTDPSPGSGVIAEMSTNNIGITTQLITPAIVGFNNDLTPSTNIYGKISNKTGVSTNITVTLTLLQLES